MQPLQNATTLILGILKYVQLSEVFTSPNQL